MSRLSPFPFSSTRRHFLQNSLILGAGMTACGITSGLMGYSVRAEGGNQSSTKIRVGIMAGEDEDLWAIVARNAEQNGLELKIIPFSDYNQPNEALAEHDLDANAFQHMPFLEAQRKAHHYAISPVGNTFFQPIGFFSQKWKSLAELPANAHIGVPNDPSNEGRALHFLESLGLLKVSADAGLFPTALDITDNPHNDTIEELDAGMVGRTLSDLDAAVINSDWAMRAGIDIKKDCIGTESLKDNPYVNFIAVNDSDLHASWVPLLVKSFQQPDIREAIQTIYHGTVTAAWS